MWFEIRIAPPPLVSGASSEREAMTFSKTLANRFLSITKIRSSPSQPPSLPVGPSLRWKLLLPSSEERLLQRRPIFQSVAPPDRFSLPFGDQLIERIRGLSRDRIYLEGRAPPLPAPATEEERRITVEEARKVLRASQMEAARAQLRLIPRSSVSYSEFSQICGDVSGGGADGGRGIARALDESGSVIVLGDVVLLRPELIARAVEGMIPQLIMGHQINDPRRRELEEMEQKKAAIDEKAETLVKRELWCGLGFLVLQTAGFMRLTFWELSWDVMEPVCFFVTSLYFMASYAFFLRTSRDPSFEGFFESRFAAKQKRLMKAHKFDLNKFNELRRAAHHLPPRSPSEGFTSSDCGCHRRSTLLGAIH